MIDGQQRLSTIRRFVVDQNLRLQDLEFLTEFNGATFDELPQSLKRRIRETNVTVYKIEKGTPEQVKFNIFRRINTGGLPLSPQEIRHALNMGPATEMLKLLAETPEFKDATGHSVPSERMGDRECVLRFLAFVLTDPRQYNEPEFDAYLSAQMKSINSMAAEHREELGARFRTAMIRAHAIFGEHAFRKVKDPKRRQPINKAVMEAWAVALDQLDPEWYALLLSQRARIMTDWVALCNTPAFFNAVSQGTGDPAKVQLRFNKVQTLIWSILEQQVEVNA